MDANWTPEPWIIYRPGVIVGGAKFDLPHGKYQQQIALTPVVDEGNGSQCTNAERIVACVNALAGVSDPESLVQKRNAELAALRESHERLRSACVLTVENIGQVQAGKSNTTARLQAAKYVCSEALAAIPAPEEPK